MNFCIAKVYYCIQLCIYYLGGEGVFPRRRQHSLFDLFECFLFHPTSWEKGGRGDRAFADYFKISPRAPLLLPPPLIVRKKIKFRLFP